VITGHINIARKAFDPTIGDRFWLEPRAFSKWEAWMDMIQLAQWRPHKMTTTKFGTIELGRGELILSIRQIRQEPSISLSIMTSTSAFPPKQHRG
jgi:hypothetical protein